jgi:anti-anti-sigma factor
MRFTVTRHERDDRVVTLAPAGEVDMCTVGTLGAAIEDTLGHPHCVGVVIDLSRVTFLDCAGISALVAGHNTAIRNGRSFTVVNPQRLVHRVLKLTGISHVLIEDPEPLTDRGARPRRPGRRRVDRRVAAGPAAASSAGVSGSRPGRSW